jgi:hypothetical protein
MCCDGDFAIASGGDKHQMLGAKAANLKTSHYVFGEIFFFFHSPLCDSLTAIGFCNLVKFCQK